MGVRGKKRQGHPCVIAGWGGVAEAALRTAHLLITGQELAKEIWLPLSFPESYDSHCFASTPVWCD